MYGKIFKMCVFLCFWLIYQAYSAAIISSLISQKEELKFNDIISFMKTKRNGFQVTTYSNSILPNELKVFIIIRIHGLTKHNRYFSIYKYSIESI